MLVAFIATYKIFIQSKNFILEKVNVPKYLFFLIHRLSGPSYVQISKKQKPTRLLKGS